MVFNIETVSTASFYFERIVILLGLNGVWPNSPWSSHL